MFKCFPWRNIIVSQFKPSVNGVWWMSWSSQQNAAYARHHESQTIYCWLGCLRSHSAGCNSLTSEVSHVLAEVDLSHPRLSLATLSNNIMTTLNSQVEITSAVQSGQLSLYKTSVKSLQKQIWRPAYYSTSTWRAKLVCVCVCGGGISHIQGHIPD